MPHSPMPAAPTRARAATPLLRPILALTVTLSLTCLLVAGAHVATAHAQTTTGGAGLGPTHGASHSSTRAATSKDRTIVRTAIAEIGSPYEYAATGPHAFDCSGLTTYAFARAGIHLPRTSFAQYHVGHRVSVHHLRPGDLVFFDTAGPGASHVGIAISRTVAISATNHGVMRTSLTHGYWKHYLIGARRVG
jgi:cell wall-associated NlpC family hydrolase